MIDFWNQRYAASEYAYGTEPNEFFKQCLKTYTDTLLPDRSALLMPAEEKVEMRYLPLVWVLMSPRLTQANRLG